MAWASKKQYAILMNSEEGKDLIQDLPNLSQDEFQVEFGKILGKSGVSYNRNEDEDYKEDEDDVLDDIGFDENQDKILPENSEEVIENGKEEWVKTEEDKKVWDSLSNNDKYLLSMSNDMGFNFDELNDYPEGRERIDELSKKFSSYQGGLSEGMSVEDVAKEHNVDVSKIKEQVKKGIEVEKEHTQDENEARKIALDHLVEMPDYYDKLNKMENEEPKVTRFDRFDIIDSLDSLDEDASQQDFFYMLGSFALNENQKEKLIDAYKNDKLDKKTFDSIVKTDNKRIEKPNDKSVVKTDNVKQAKKNNVKDEVVNDAIKYYKENAFGYDGLRDYVETDFSHYKKEDREEIYNRMKKKIL